MRTDEPRAQEHTVEESNCEAKTTLLLEGVSPDELPASVLLNVVDTCEAEDLPVDGVSVIRDSTRK